MRQQRTVGAIVEIPLEAGQKAYRLILGEASFAFYDFVNSGEPVVLSDLVTKPILFVVAVYSDAVTKGRWKKIGRLPLESILQTLPRTFIQDVLDETRFEVHDNGVIRPAIREECVGLEREAVWEPEQVESRLSNYYKGQPNKWDMQLRIR